MTFLASQDKNKLVNKLTKDATSVFNAYVEKLEIDPLPAENSPLELSPVQADANPSKTVSQTLYVPSLFPNCSVPQWALVDSGA